VGVRESKAATNSSGEYCFISACRLRKKPKTAEMFFPSLFVSGLLMNAKYER